MRNPVRIAVVLMLLVLAGVLGWDLWRMREPVYQGKRLSHWLASSSEDSGSSLEAETAVRAMGTDAVPTLVGMVGTRDSRFRNVSWKIANRLSVRCPSYAWPQRVLQEMGCHGFKLLGAIAQPAVPPLAQFLDSDDPSVRFYAAHSLARIGPAARDAAPALAQYLNRALQQKSGTKWDALERYAAGYALCEIGAPSQPALPQPVALATFTNEVAGRSRACAEAALIKIRGDSLHPILEALKDTSSPTNWFYKHGGQTLFYLGTNAEPAIPVLLLALQQTNVFLQDRALEILGRVHAHPETCVPAITPFLQSSNLWTVAAALEALRAFGGAARNALTVSAITRCLEFKYIPPWPHAGNALWHIPVRLRATNALWHIDPEAAAKAGIR